MHARHNETVFQSTKAINMTGRRLSVDSSAAREEKRYEHSDG